jgi:RNA polymerase sigma-70 factor (ECF subfamily)
LIGDIATGRARDIPGDTEAPADDTLVVAAQRDPAAFGALYVRYVDLVYRFCYRRLGNQAAAEDATSRIFERAMNALPRYRAGSFRSWLFTIARNTVTDLHRADRKERRLPETWDVQDRRPGPEQQTIDADQAQWVRGLLSHLTEDQRRVVELRLAGLTDIEIAAVLGRSRGSVRTIQFRAIRKLRALVAEDATQEQRKHTGADPRAQI